MIVYVGLIYVEGGGVCVVALVRGRYDVILVMTLVLMMLVSMFTCVPKVLKVVIYLSLHT